MILPPPPRSSRERTKTHWDKSPQGQEPTRTKAHWTISHCTKAHCLNRQGGQKPTSLKNRFKSFFKRLTLIRLLLQGNLQTLLFLLYVVTYNIIWVLKPLIFEENQFTVWVKHFINV